MIDPAATHPVEVRCLCPGAPHPSDTITVRSEYGYGDALKLAKAAVQYRVVQNKKGEPVVLPYEDAFLQEEALLALGVKAWTLLDADGNPVPVGLPTILLLPPDVGEQVSTAINALYEASKVPVPNGSGAPSRASTPGSSAARPNRATRRSKRPSTLS